MLSRGRERSLSADLCRSAIRATDVEVESDQSEVVVGSHDSSGRRHWRGPRRRGWDRGAPLYAGIAVVLSSEDGPEWLARGRAETPPQGLLSHCQRIVCGRGGLAHSPLCRDFCACRTFSDSGLTVGASCALRGCLARALPPSVYPSPQDRRQRRSRACDDCRASFKRAADGILAAARVERTLRRQRLSPAPPLLSFPLSPRCPLASQTPPTLST